MRDPKLGKWTPERVKLMVAMVDDYATAAQIADAIGAGVSRNAVIGKLHRMGMTTANPQGPHSNMAKRKRKRVSPQIFQRESAINAVRAEKLAELAASEAVELPPDQSEFAMTFDEMKPGDKRCRYPFGNPLDFKDFRFCGAPQEDGCPYCARHFRLTHHRARNVSPEEIERRRRWGYKLATLAATARSTAA